VRFSTDVSISGRLVRRLMKGDRKMRDLILGMSMSLDGFVAGPNNENDWILPTGSPDGKAWKLRSVSSAGVHIMGSRSFAGWASYWPSSSDVFAPPMNEIPKVVFARRGRPAIEPAPASATTAASTEALASWRDGRVASGPLAEEIARLKREEGGPIFAHGGASFAQSLVRADLVDEYRLAVHPVALGRGKALFGTLDTRSMLALVECTRFDGGAIGLVYRRR
jgi:dihydrofolate reductase